MAQTVRDVLLKALDDLSVKSFKRFRNKITDWEIEEGFKKIPRSKLENPDSDDVVDLIRNHYMDSYGPELVLAVLDAIDEKQVASDLRKDLENVPGFSWREKPKDPQSTSKDSSSASASCSGPKKHFVDEHREALINGVPLVAPILDSLMSEDLLTYEAYQTIKTAGTSYEQMRKLCYEHVSSWKEPQKDVFKNALRKHNRVLVENLERS